MKTFSNTINRVALLRHKDGRVNEVSRSRIRHPLLGPPQLNSMARAHLRDLRWHRLPFLCRARRGFPAFIGSSWFQWVDQPCTGRMDGENYNIGLVDLTDRPYADLIVPGRTGS
jgi:hypothetical protein